MSKLKNYALLLAIVAGFAVVYVKKHSPLDRQAMEKEILEYNARLPRNIDVITTQTRVELAGQTITNYYSISEAMSSDAATTEIMRQSTLKRTCATAESRKLLSLGYSIGSVYTVLTKGGPDQIRVLIKPTDCG